MKSDAPLEILSDDATAGNGLPPMHRGAWVLLGETRYLEPADARCGPVTALERYPQAHTSSLLALGEFLH